MNAAAHFRIDQYADLTPEEKAGIASIKRGFQAAAKAWDSVTKKWKEPRPADSPDQTAAFEAPATTTEKMLMEGRVVALADFDDSIGFNTDFTPAVQNTAACSRVLRDLCEQRTGIVVAEEVYQKLQDRRAAIMRQSLSVAKKLSEAGILAYTQSEQKLWLVDIVKFVTDPNFGVHAYEQPAFRRCNFIPIVAQQKRAAVLRLLEYWLQSHPYARFWTFTIGQRCPVMSLRDRIQALHRKVSRLNSETFMAEFGVEIVFRSTETGSLTDEQGAERKDDAGNWLFHPHAHCVIELKNGRISPEKWEVLLKKVKSFMGANWDEGGQILDARECVKYPVKPTDTERLNAAETSRLFYALERLHLVQPLGSLKKLAEEAQENGKTFVRRKVGENLELVQVPNWNKHGARPKLSLDDTLALAEREQKSDTGTSPKAVAVLAPGPFFGRTTRPAVLVRSALMGRSQLEEVCKMPQVAAAIAAAIPRYERGEAIRLAPAPSHGPIRVHTSPVTVRTEDQGDQAQFHSIVGQPIASADNSK